MDFGLPDLFPLVSRQKHQTIPISIRGRVVFGLRVDFFSIQVKALFYRFTAI